MIDFLQECEEYYNNKIKGKILITKKDCSLSGFISYANKDKQLIDVSDGDVLMVQMKFRYNEVYKNVVICNCIIYNLTKNHKFGTYKVVFGLKNFDEFINNNYIIV